MNSNFVKPFIYGPLIKDFLHLETKKYENYFDSYENMVHIVDGYI